MKIQFLTLLIVAFCQLNAQNFINHYSSDCTQNGTSNLVDVDYPTEMRFSCITTKESNLLIAGPLKTTNDLYKGLVLTEIDVSGVLLDIHRIYVESGDADIYPTGLLWEAIDNSAIICGYMGLAGYNLSDPALIPHAFILKYDYVSHAIIWIRKIFHNYTYFLDIAKRSDGDYVLCGQFSASTIKDTEDAVLYSADNLTGNLSKLTESRGINSTGTSDTWQALEVTGNNVFTSGRFEYYNTDGKDGMRPVLSKYNMITPSLSTSGYVRTIIGSLARLYAVDVTKSVLTYVMAINGDLNSDINTDEDLIIAKINSALISSWQRLLNFPTTIKDGRFHSIKTYNGDGSNDLVVYGSTPELYDNKPFLTKITADGNSVSWSYKYDNITAPPDGCPNSMIIFGDYIFAVGWHIDNSEDVGVLLKTHINEGTTGCSTALYPTLSSIDQTFTTVPIILDVPLYITNPVNYIKPCTSTTTTPCYEARIGENSLLTSKVNLLNSNHNELIISLDDYNQTNIYVLNIYNILGQKVIQYYLTSLESTFNLESGIYIYQLIIDQNLANSGKFVVK